MTHGAGAAGLMGEGFQMTNFRQVFFIGVVGGLVGYACGAAFTPTRAIAQQINPEDAGTPPASLEQDAGAAAPTLPAAGPQPACRQWEVKVDPRGIYNNTGAVLMDEGWEPFSYSQGAGAMILRRCVR